jgi:hypothetical protein
VVNVISKIGKILTNSFPGVVESVANILETVAYIAPERINLRTAVIAAAGHRFAGLSRAGLSRFADQIGTGRNGKHRRQADGYRPKTKQIVHDNLSLAGPNIAGILRVRHKPRNQKSAASQGQACKPFGDQNLQKF